MEEIETLGSEQECKSSALNNSLCIQKLLALVSTRRVGEGHTWNLLFHPLAQHPGTLASTGLPVS